MAKKSPIVLSNCSSKVEEAIVQAKANLLGTNRSASFSDAVEALLFPDSKGDISDGYHTFNELYQHRIVNFMALCRFVNIQYVDSPEHRIWKSRKHSDGSVWDGWFILGIGTAPGEQITYHLPGKYWDLCEFEALEQAPDFDGHTSADVLERISKL